MRRIARATAVGLVMFVIGCQGAKKDREPDQSAQLDYGALQPDLYVTTAQTVVDAPVSNDYVIYDQPADAFETMTSSGLTHVVVKGDTLYRLARKYYSDQGQWKVIYEANRGALRDPNKLHVGQELMIP